MPAAVMTEDAASDLHRHAAALAEIDRKNGTDYEGEFIEASALMLDEIGEHPERGRLRDDLEYPVMELWSRAVGRYFMFYTQATQPSTVVMVLHQREDVRGKLTARIPEIRVE